ncbi:hypothetical protein CLU79DRAFT_745660 [Phycomyces nitens]|nr:hypothetical protein CLU79DRAFT_745660 [Phycomyces nitens]
MPPNKAMIDSWDNVPLYYPQQLPLKQKDTQTTWKPCEIDKAVQDRPFVTYLDQLSLASYESLSMREQVTSISSLRDGLCRTPSPQTTSHPALSHATHSHGPDIATPVYLYKSNTLVVPHQISTGSARKSTALPMPQQPSTPASPVSSVSSQSSQSSQSSNPARNFSAKSKRDNHILSEQRRRNMIRTGFKEMTDLIPTLKNISQSKSIILFKAADYMKDLERRNKHLRDKLASLQWRAKLKGQVKHHPVKSSPLVPLSHQDHLKQVRLLQDQIRQQQRLLIQHNLPTMQSNPNHVNNFTPTQAIVMPMSKEDHSPITWHSSSASSSASSLTIPSLSIPIDTEFGPENVQHDSWLSSSKLNHFQ